MNGEERRVLRQAANWCMVFVQLFDVLVEFMQGRAGSCWAQDYEDNRNGGHWLWCGHKKNTCV